MDSEIHSRRDEAERLRGYFEVQLLFAETIARRTSTALSDCALRFTNLHRRLGCGRIEDGEHPAEWAAYVFGLNQCRSRPERLEWTVAYFAGAPAEQHAKQTFGCFSYELADAGQVVRIHFSNRDSSDGCGPLALAKMVRRLSELREMFGYVRNNHESARSVRGGSWLYNLEAYRRLFPLEYARSTFEPERVRLDGTSSWGQVLDFRGLVKPFIRQAILDNVEAVHVSAPWQAFPMRALAAQGAAELFYKFYRL